MSCISYWYVVVIIMQCYMLTHNILIQHVLNKYEYKEEED